MTALVKAFQFDDYNLRVQVDDDGRPWFNASDACEPLGLGNPRDAISRHVDQKDVGKRDTLTAGGTQAQNYVNESGLYALILGSTKPEAKAFKSWVTGEVLPSIRKTGSFVQRGGAVSEPDIVTSLRQEWQEWEELRFFPRLEQTVERVVERAIGKVMPNFSPRRKEVSAKDYGKHQKFTLHVLQNQCPSCHKQIEAGKFRVDHFKGPTEAQLSCTWGVCDPCNNKLRNADFHASRESNFAVYQQRMKAWLLESDQAVNGDFQIPLI